MNDDADQWLQHIVDSELTPGEQAISDQEMASARNIMAELLTMYMNFYLSQEAGRRKPAVALALAFQQRVSQMKDEEFLPVLVTLCNMLTRELIFAHGGMGQVLRAANAGTLFAQLPNDDGEVGDPDTFIRLEEQFEKGD